MDSVTGSARDTWSMSFPKGGELVVRGRILCEARGEEPRELPSEHLNLAWTWLIEHPAVAWGVARREPEACAQYRRAVVERGLPMFERVVEYIAGDQG